MHAPRASHLHSANQVIRYLKGTLGRGCLFIKQNGGLHLEVYMDAHYARSLVDHCSTPGYCAFLGRQSFNRVE